MFGGRARASAKEGGDRAHLSSGIRATYSMSVIRRLREIIVDLEHGGRVADARLPSHLPMPSMVMPLDVAHTQLRFVLLSCPCGGGRSGPVWQRRVAHQRESLIS